MKISKLFRKVTSVLVSAVIAAGMLTSAVGASAAQTTPPGNITIYHEFATQNAEAISALADGLRQMKGSIRLDKYKVNLNDSRKLLEATLNMYPELFYVDIKYALNYTPGSDGQYYLYCFLPEYNYTQAEVNEMMTAFDEKSEFFLSKINNNMTDFEKALILHDELILNSSYLLEGTTYSLMVDGTGKCEDYSRAYAFLLAQAGVKCEMIMSPKTSPDDELGMEHQWLKVCIDGTYYHVDPTWDDPTIVNASDYETSGETRPNGYTGLVQHTFFLLSDDLIGSTALGTPHTGYTSYFASPSTYDNALFHSVNSRFCYLNGSFYAVKYNNTNYDTQIVRYNPANDTAETLKSFPYRWTASSGGAWIGCFSNISSLDRKLYFNGPDAVYSYNPETGSFSTYASKPSTNQFYGMNIIGRDVYGYTAASPFELQDKVYLGQIDEPPLAVGDVNADDVVDIRDVTMVQRYLAGILTLDSRQLAAADFVGDGQVDISDATFIQRYIAHLY